MSKGIGKAFAVGLVVAALSAVGAGGALAAPPKGGPAKAAAAYIGITVEQLRTELKAGKSMAQVATANGKTEAGLEAAIVADAKTHLASAVADGKLTAEKAATALERLQANVDKIVNRTGPPAKGGPGKGGKGKGGKAVARAAAKITAEYTGLSVEQVRDQQKAGKSLAEIAEGAGKTVAGLKAKILADSKATIDKLVAEGKLTAERGKQYYDQLVEKIDDIVNKKRTTS